MYEKIKELCKKKKVSVSKMEQDLGFAKGYLGKLNKTSPSVKNAKRIADYLEVDINVLIA